MRDVNLIDEDVKINKGTNRKFSKQTQCPECGSHFVVKDGKQ